MPCARVSRVYEVSCRVWATFGAATNVPALLALQAALDDELGQRLRTGRARRAELRARERSVGTGLPGGSVLVSRSGGA